MAETLAWDQRPWAARATELRELEGPYADLAAFEEWFKARELDEFIEADGILELIPVYHSFTEALGVEETIPDRSQVNAGEIF